MNGFAETRDLRALGRALALQVRVAAKFARDEKMKRGCEHCLSGDGCKVCTPRLREEKDHV